MRRIGFDTAAIIIVVVRVVELGRLVVERNALTFDPEIELGALRQVPRSQCLIREDFGPDTGERIVLDEAEATSHEFDTEVTSLHDGLILQYLNERHEAPASSRNCRSSPRTPSDMIAIDRMMPMIEMTTRISISENARL